VRLLAAFVSGALFALGLAISGMTDPTKVTGFLDVFGPWDPSLGLVMAAALAVHVGPVRWILRRGRPLLDNRLHLAAFTQVDARLVGGAALFGVGWGLGGYCPGPAIVSAGSGLGQGIVFTASMIGGMALYHAFARARVADDALVVAPAPVPAQVPPAR